MKFPVKHAVAIGACAGALSGAAISLAMEVSLSVALTRIAVLAFAAGLGGAVLVWLDHGLRRAEAHSREQSHQ